jgi:cyclohexanone monooxygenase
MGSVFTREDWRSPLVPLRERRWDKMAIRKLRVAVIGAGVSGIAAAIKLRDLGVDDILVFEKAEDIGGTWRENTYPGLTCDVPSHLYRFSFAPNPDWSHRYSAGPEIQAYVRGVVARFALAPLIRLSTEVTAVTYGDGRWLIDTNHGSEGAFDVVITATGVLHHPVWPSIPGLETFRGPAFHTARWDHGFDLSGKRVGIIGTGSTAAQVLPAIVDRVAKVSLFQRTAQWIMPQPNPPISDSRRQGYRADPALLAAKYDELAKVFNGAFCAAVAGENAEAYDAMVQACQDNLSTVRDPDLRARLTPDYKVGCKRLIVSDLFYPAIQKPNAELVTTAISHVTTEGVVTSDGRLHGLDGLVLATGFNTHQLFRPMTVTGRRGDTLDEVWAGGNEAYKGVSIPDFPNFFMLGGPNSPIGNFSFIMTAERQMDFVLQLVKRLQDGQAREISAGHAPMKAYNRALKAKMDGSIWASGCRSWYIDRNGNVASFPWSYEKFEDDMRAPILEDFDVI